MYGDVDGVQRVVRQVTESPWTEEDRALLLAYQLYLDSLCSGCGEPRHLAHHPDNDGWYGTDADPVVCHGCTALAKADAKEPDKVEPVKMHRVVHDRDYGEHPLPILTLDDVTA